MATDRLSYFVGNEHYSVNNPLYLLGYMLAHNRVYLTDKDLYIYGYSLALSVVEYPTAVLRGNTDAAAEIFSSQRPAEQSCTFPRKQRPQRELAIQVTTDADHKFELALQLGDLDTALEIARSVHLRSRERKWKALGDRALAVWRFDLARECFGPAGDLSALMLLLMATGDRKGLEGLVAKADEFFGRMTVTMC